MKKQMNWRNELKSIINFLTSWISIPISWPTVGQWGNNSFIGDSHGSSCSMTKHDIFLTSTL